MKKRAISILLCICMLTSIFAGMTISASAASITDHMTTTFNSALRLAGVSSFDGYCGNCVGYQLWALGINTSLYSGNGNETYGLYASMSKTSGGYSIGKYPASSYSLSTFINNVNAQNKSGAYTYIVLGFKKGSSNSAGQTWGHTLLIYQVYGGTVYFTESWGDAVRSLSISEFCSTEGKGYGCRTSGSATIYQYDGAIWFGGNIVPPNYELKTGTYYFKNKATGTYLDAQSSGDVIVKSFNGGDNQKWDVSASSGTGTNTVAISPKNSTKMLNNYGDIVSAGCNVNLYNNTGDASQRWGLEAKNGGYVIHSAQNSNVVIEAVNGNAQMATNSGADNQIWILENTLSAPPVPTIQNITIAGSSVTVTWSSVSGATSYAVDFWNPETDYHDYRTITETTYTTYLSDGQYGIRVCAKNTAGETYNTDGFHYIDIKPAPSLQVNTNADGSRTLYWTDIGWDGYYVMANSKPDFSQNYFLLANTSSTTWTDKTLLEAGTWYYCVQGYTSSSYGNYSNVVAIDVTSGACGENATWMFDTDTGTLTIRGTGAMYDYSSLLSEAAPWHAYWSDIQTVTIAEGITSIGDFAFWDYNNLTSVTIPNSVMSIGNRAFCGCTSLTSITIPDSVTSIGVHAFEGCQSLTSIEIPNSVTNIGDGAFYQCIRLSSVTIPNSVTSIGISAFRDCWNITSIEIPGSVTSIGDDAFSICSSLTSVTIPDSVTSIGKNVFEYCSSLTSVTIPNTVTSIGDYAFCESTNLKDVYYDGTEAEWNAITIGRYNEALLNATIHFLDQPHTHTPGTAVRENEVAADCKNAGSYDEVFYCTECNEELSRTTKTIPITNNHTFVNGVCTVCNAPDPNYNPNPDPNAMKLSAAAVKTTAGKEIHVLVKAENNPGLNSLKLSFDYDSSVLSLVSATDQGLFESAPTKSKNLTDKPYNLIWATPGNATGNGDLVELVFRVSVTAQPSVQPITVTAQNAFNEQDAVVNVTCENVLVTIVRYEPGDANGDDTIDLRDATRILQYLVGWDVTVEEEGADTNGDGQIDARDATRLLQYFAGWDVKLGK